MSKLCDRPVDPAFSMDSPPPAPPWLGLTCLPSAADVPRLSPTALAYLGDAVYELYIRSHYLFPPQRIQDYHQQVVSQVRAETQARYLAVLDVHLTPTEREIVKRGRNASSAGPKRLDPKIYQQATGLETLIGYLYLTDPDRLTQLFGHLELSQTAAQ